MKWLKKRWKVTLLSLVLVLIAGIGGYTWWLYDSLQGMNKGTEPTPFTNIKPVSNTEDPPAPEPPEWEGEERVNILLLGADARGLEENEVPRSDTMLIASIDPKTKKATLMSILRDTYIDIPDYGRDRANAALAVGGPYLAMRTLSEWTGLSIQYYVYTDFQGFIKLIDALGGIEFEVEKDMYYTSKADGHEYDINLKKGLQLLDGESALQYVRFRHDALSDYSRTKRQRELLTAIANEMKSAWSLIQLPHLINQISPYVDTNLSVDDMIKLGRLGMGLSMTPNLQLPPSELLRETEVGSAQVLTVSDPEQLKQYIQEAFTDTQTTDSGSNQASPSGSH